jgi:hypothetical protein
LAALVIVLGCGQGKKPKPFDGRTAALLARATKVEVFRIDGGKDHEPPVPPPGEGNVGGFPVTARGYDQGPAFAARLAEVLSDEKTYADGFAKCYWPGVAFRVWDDKECVDFIVCFFCDNFYLGPPSYQRVSENGTFHGTPARPLLVRLAKEAFPDDKEIQGLKEIRSPAGAAGPGDGNSPTGSAK